MWEYLLEKSVLNEEREKSLLAGFIGGFVIGIIFSILLFFLSNKFSQNWANHICSGHNPNVEDKKKDMGFPLNYSLVGNEDG